MDVREFPEGWRGRQRYVTVRNHSGLVASCYTYIGHDGRYYLHPDYGGDLSGIHARSELKTPYIMRDIGEYKSPLDGTMITSRSAHREHMRTHDVIEVGNEPIGNMSSIDAHVPKPGEIGELVKRHIEEVKALPQSTYDEKVKALAHGPE